MVVKAGKDAFPLVSLSPLVSKGADPPTCQLQESGPHTLPEKHKRADPIDMDINEPPRKHECGRFGPYGGVDRGRDALLPSTLPLTVGERDSLWL